MCELPGVATLNVKVALQPVFEMARLLFR